MKSFELKANVPITFIELFGELDGFKTTEPFILYIYRIDGVIQTIFKLGGLSSPKHISDGNKYEFTSCANNSFQSVTGCKVEYRITQSGKHIAE